MNLNVVLFSNKRAFKKTQALFSFKLTKSFRKTFKPIIDFMLNKACNIMLTEKSESKPLWVRFQIS